VKQKAAPAGQHQRGSGRMLAATLAGANAKEHKQNTLRKINNSNKTNNN